MLPNSLYNMKNLVKGLGFTVEDLDYCKDGCMIWWGTDAGYALCKVCDDPRFKNGKVRSMRSY